MAVPGIVDSTYFEVPANVDQTYLRRYETADGVTFDQLVPRINAAFAAFNGEVDPTVAELTTRPTTNIIINGRHPGRFKVERQGEYGPERPQKPGKPVAHALPIWVDGAAMGFTERGLRFMTAESILAEFEEALNGFRYNHKMAVLGRLLDDAEVPVDDANATTMLSPGFAGSGTGLNAFSAAYYPDFTAIGGGYSHYWRIAEAGLSAGMLALRNQHRKWFPTGKFDFVGSQDMVDAIVALDEAGGFIRAERAFIREGSGNTVAQVDPDTYVGILHGDIWVRKPIMDFTDPNGWLFQPLGNFNPRNPLAWRYDPKAGGGAGRGAYVRTVTAWPLSDANILQEFGIGVNNRVGAELIRMADSGTYEPPTGFSAG